MEGDQIERTQKKLPSESPYRVNYAPMEETKRRMPSVSLSAALATMLQKLS